MKRKVSYLRIAEEAVPRLLSLQYKGSEKEKKGCFFYPFAKGDTDFANSRWQEAVLTIAWLKKTQDKKEKSLEESVVSGIDFWCRIQNKDGSFPEYCKGDRSFSATAFSTIAVSEAMEIVGRRDGWITHLRRAGDWLCENDETVMTNQEAAACFALLRLYDILKDRRYLNGSERKLSIVLKNQSKEGYYKEKCACDIGYSSLTLEMLGKYYLLRKVPEILESAGRFVRFFNSAPDTGVRNSRNTDWVILDGFEIFAKYLPEARLSVKGITGNGRYDFIHLRDERHLCTDSYRHCWAHDNSCFETDVKPFKLPAIRKTPIPKAGYGFLRRFGVHKFRKLKYRCLR